MLIPKVNSLESVDQFRPISLCNFAYKIISKILVNRIKPMMGILITQNQAAFIKGRQIHYNILVANEAFHYLKLKKRGKRFQIGSRWI